MKYNHKILRDDILGELELATVSKEFWEQAGRSPLQIPYVELLAFQNGWAACKEYYGIRNERPSTGTNTEERT